jgi:hypothetical protein
MELMDNIEKRKIEVVFVREYKNFIAKFSKKEKGDYILNVSKLIKDKFNTKFIIPNKVQSFLLNYEIKKLLDKAIKVKNKKYTTIIYLNSNLSLTSILNTIEFMNNEYDSISFTYSLIESKESDPIDSIPTDLNIISV